MKPTATKIIAILAFGLITHTTFALTETVDGVTWHYVVSPNGAIIQPPNIASKGSNGYELLPAYDGDEPSRYKYSLLPAHEGALPKVLTIPDKLGGKDVYAIAIGSIQLSNDAGVELIIIPSTVQGISNGAIIGEFEKYEFSNAYNIGGHAYTRGYWYCKPPSEHGLTGVLCLGDKNYLFDVYNSGSDVLKIDVTNKLTDEIIISAEGGALLQPKLYYVEGVMDNIANPIHNPDGSCYGAAKVEIEPKGCIYNGTIEVSLACTNSTANIYYTLDGSEPTTNGTDRCFLYSAPITLMHSATVKALAHVTEYPYTVVYSERYALGQTQPPSIISTNGDVFNLAGNKITLSCETEDAKIRYTLDGREPTEESALYTEPFTIDDTTTVKAKAFKTDWFESETAVVTFTREWYTVETPVITPGDTTFENASQEVSIGCDTEGATIYYTTDGSDPKENGREYRHPFMVYNTCTVRTIAVKYDWKDSAETTATFTRNEALSAAANLYGYNMETSDAAWIVDGEVSHDGVSSIKSNGDGSYVQTSVRGAGTLSFWWRAMCEEPEGGEYYDYGVFKVGSAEAAYIAGNDTGWVFFSTNIATTGKHKLSWEYRKDEEGTFAPDCIWLDQVQWIPADGSGYTLTTPEPVPYSWLTEYGLGSGSDFESAGNALSGKVQGGKETKVWEEFVAGTDPTNETSVLTAMIEMQDGVPIITWEPNLNTNGEVRLYKVYGKETLSSSEDWAYPTNSLHRFFKVTVEMP